MKVFNQGLTIITLLEGSVADKLGMEVFLNELGHFWTSVTIEHSEKMMFVG